MAKLNARGREEWLRVQLIRGRDSGGSIRVQRAYMSDGHILERHTFLKPDGKVDFDDGWKDKGKSKLGFDVEVVKAARLGAGWTVVKHAQAR